MTERIGSWRLARGASLMMAGACAILLAAAAPDAARAQAETAPQAERAPAQGTDRLFATDQLDNLEPQAELVYAHRRRVPDGTQAVAIGQGEIRIRRAGGGDAEAILVSMAADGRDRVLDPLPGGSGNPVLVVFLESALRAMARATGGSQFYLRNRIKEALYAGASVEPVTATLDGAEVAGERLVYRPFSGDPHLTALGQGYERLEVAFVLADAVPGRFVSLALAAPDEAVPFHEEVRLIEGGAQ